MPVEILWRCEHCDEPLTKKQLERGEFFMHPAVLEAMALNGLQGLSETPPRFFCCESCLEDYLLLHPWKNCALDSCRHPVGMMGVMNNGKTYCSYGCATEAEIRAEKTKREIPAMKNIEDSAWDCAQFKFLIDIDKQEDRMFATARINGSSIENIRFLIDQDYPESILYDSAFDKINVSELDDINGRVYINHLLIGTLNFYDIFFKVKENNFPERKYDGIIGADFFELFGDVEYSENFIELRM